MSEYITVRNFWDTEVRTEEYPKGKSYKEGLKVSEERLRQLSTYDNSAGDIFIKKVDENKETINPFKDEGTETEEEVKEKDEGTETEEEVKEKDEGIETEETTEVKEPKTKKASTRGRRKKTD